MSKIRALLNVSEFGVRLDWATFSAPIDEEEAYDFAQFAEYYMAQEKALFEVVDKQRLGAYNGIRIGDTSYVKRAYDGHEMLIASGTQSNHLTEEVIRYGIKTRATRLDVRATARTKEAAPRYPERLRGHILRVREKKGKEFIKKMALFDGGCGNTGVTIGSRTSESYGRIYDDEAKHGACATALVWAHEAEFKGDTSQGLFEGLTAEGFTPKYLAGVMRRRLERWDVPCAWLGDSDKITIMRTTKESTDEKRLRYVDRTLLPILSGLVDRNQRDALRALIVKHGLDDLFEK